MVTFLVLVLGFSFLLLLSTATVIAVRRDGSGHLPPVPSHHSWDDTGPASAAAGNPGTEPFRR